MGRNADPPFNASADGPGPYYFITVRKDGLQYSGAPSGTYPLLKLVKQILDIARFFARVSFSLIDLSKYAGTPVYPQDTDGQIQQAPKLSRTSMIAHASARTYPPFKRAILNNRCAQNRGRHGANSPNF